MRVASEYVGEGGDKVAGSWADLGGAAVVDEQLDQLGLTSAR